MSSQKQFPVIDKVMTDLGFKLVTVQSDLIMFRNWTAEYEKADCFAVKFIKDRQDLCLDIKPLIGLFASARWYPLGKFLQALKENGYPVVWAKDHEIDSVETYIGNTMKLLISIKDRLQFSCLDGISLRKKQEDEFP